MSLTNWTRCKIGDRIEFIYGKGLPKKKRNLSGKFPVYGSNGIVDFHDEFLVAEPSIIVGRKGAAGKIHITNKPFWPIDTTYFVTPPEDINLNFLFYYLQTLKLEKHDRSTAIPGLNREDAYSQELIYPSLEVQHHIVSKIEELFSELDKGIESLQKAKVQLKTYRQAVLKAAFEGKLTEWWRISKQQFDLIDLKDSFSEQEMDYFGEIPNEWKYLRSKSIIKTINNGYTPKVNFLSQDHGDIPFIKVYNLNFDGSFNFAKKPTFIPNKIHRNDLKRSITYPGDVLINIVGPPLGKVSIVSKQYPEWNINQAIVMLRPNELILNKYLSYYLQNPATIRWLESTSKATAGQYNIKVTTCREIPIAYCPVEEQKAVVQEIESRLSVCDHIEKSIDEQLLQAEALKQSILKKAFEGRLV